MQPVRNALAVAHSNFSRAHPKAKIPLEESLSINTFVGKDKGGPPGDYHLRGVVHHIGGTASSGHYTTCAKRTLPSDRTGVDGGKERSSAYTLKDNEEQWVFFDDRVGAKKDLEHVAGMEKNQRNCYMALYELR